MAKQPFYYDIQFGENSNILFTLTQEISEEEFKAAIEKALKPYGYVKGSLEVFDMIWCGGEPGDPSDL